MAKLAELASLRFHKCMHRRPGDVSVECNVMFGFLYVHPYLRFGGTVLWEFGKGIANNGSFVR